MIHGNSCEGDKSDSKWERELILCKQESNHNKWERHDDRVEDDNWLCKAIEEKCKECEYRKNGYKECDQYSKNKILVFCIFSPCLVANSRWKIIGFCKICKLCLCFCRVDSLFKISPNRYGHKSCFTLNRSYGIFEHWFYKIPHSVGFWTN